MNPLPESSPRQRPLRSWLVWLALVGAPMNAHAAGSGTGPPTPARHPAHLAPSASTGAGTRTGTGSNAKAAKVGGKKNVERHDDPEPLPPNRWRAALEMALVLGGGTVWYAIDERNVLDWDRPSTRERLNGKAWRFDNNGPVVNLMLHPLSGASFYSLARANRIGLAESFLYSVITSTTWEYVIEFKEKISINDMIITPMGGFTIGAFADKLARYLNDVPSNGTAHSVAQWLLGPTIRIQRTMDGELPPDGAARDQLGLAATIWHAFELQYQGGWIGQDGHPSWSAHDFGFKGTLASLPGYRRPGRVARWFYDADISRLGFTVDWTRSDAGGSLVTDTLLAGYHRQRLRGPADAPRGVMWTTALGLGYRYRHTREFGFDDREGVVGFPGPALDLYAASNALRAELSVRANAEFAGQTSLAAPEWREEHPGVRTKTIIEREGYFFGWGGSLAAWGEASLGPFWSRAHVRTGWYDSQEGLDRAQQRLEDDTEFHEIVREYGFSLGLELCPALRVGGAYEVRHRLSTAGSAAANQAPVATNRAAEHVGGLVQVAF